jgi:uncharacterized membrane protein
MPFATGWMGENHFAKLPVALYAFDLTMCAVAYNILQSQIIKLHGDKSILALAIGHDRKGKFSLGVCCISMPIALLGYPWFAVALLMLVSLIWFIPDRRIEKLLSQ